MVGDGQDGSIAWLAEARQWSGSSIRVRWADRQRRRWLDSRPDPAGTGAGRHDEAGEWLVWA